MNIYNVRRYDNNYFGFLKENVFYLYNLSSSNLILDSDKYISKKNKKRKMQK